MVKFQPWLYRKTGTPTTNHTSRAPNKNTRAPASKLIARLLPNNSLNDLEALALPIITGSDQTTAIKTTNSTDAINQSEPLNPH